MDLSEIKKVLKLGVDVSTALLNANGSQFKFLALLGVVQKLGPDLMDLVSLDVKKLYTQWQGLGQEGRKEICDYVQSTFNIDNAALESTIETIFGLLIESEYVVEKWLHLAKP